MTPEQIIDYFGMKPLPDEGGYYVETYRATEKLSASVLPQRYTETRNISTAILYLLTDETFSAMHRLKSDEVFHFYLGDPVTMLLLDPKSSSQIVTLGQDILNGQKLQQMIPRGTWQGCCLKQGGKLALMGATVAPGFEFEDYENADKNELLEMYPQQKELILRLVR
ncbi:MAG: cupin domain-containing protein [Planctomycetota bacterium]|jgi:predicted cupin superfamily sugar epimerase